MTLVRTSIVALAAAASFVSYSSAATVFSSNGQSLSPFTVLKETGVPDLDSTADVINYTTLGIPEAPGGTVGDLPTTGIQLTANKGDATAAVTGINLLLGDSTAGTAAPQTFTGTHTLEYYVWMNVPAGASGTSEYFSSGVVRSTSDLPIYNNFRTGRGNGGWMVLDGDNGLATDYRHLNNGVAATSVTGSDATPAFADKLNAAFVDHVSTTVGAADDAANEWVKVDVVYDAVAGATSVYLNGVFFSTVATTNTSGIAWLGYEDGSAAIGSVGVAGIFDNIRLIEGNAIPEPTTLAGLAGLGMLATARRRKA